MLFPGSKCIERNIKRFQNHAGKRNDVKHQDHSPTCLASSASSSLSEKKMSGAAAASTSLACWSRGGASDDVHRGRGPRRTRGRGRSQSACCPSPQRRSRPSIVATTFGLGWSSTRSAGNVLDTTWDWASGLFEHLGTGWAGNQPASQPSHCQVDQSRPNLPLLCGPNQSSQTPAQPK